MKNIQNQSLRERKKVKTRAMIQAQALRLFREQGYEKTTIEQIAEASEVSPSTVFRYYTTKPSLVFSDDFDEFFLRKFKMQPHDLSLIEAIRNAVRDGLTTKSGEELSLIRDRLHLMQNIPELRAAMLDESIRTVREVSNLIAERTGRSADDYMVISFAGALLSVEIAAWFAAEGDGDDNWINRFIELTDKGLDMLESGFRL